MVYKFINISNLKLCVAKTNEGITFIDSENIEHELLKLGYVKASSNEFLELETQLKEYVNGTRKTFSLKLNFKGTPFQTMVWNELLKIEFGKTVSYESVAINLGDIKKTRAVANAIGKNPIMIVVPCHRVIGKNGKLHGFSGGLELKQRLLDHEK